MSYLIETFLGHGEYTLRVMAPLVLHKTDVLGMWMWGAGL